MIDNLYSFRGGGGGSLIDVRVNGESVVTDKIASITSYMEITQAEYDELPSSKTSDGVAYFISDTSKLILNGTQYDLPASGGFAEPSDSYGSNGDIYIKYKQSSIVPYLDNYEIGYDGDGYFDTGLVVTNLPTCTLDVKQYGMVSETEELLFEYNESVDLKNISHYLSIYDDNDNPVCTISLASSQNPITMQIEKHNTPSVDFRLEISVYQDDSVPHEIENIYYKVDGQWICTSSKYWAETDESILRGTQANWGCDPEYYFENIEWRYQVHWKETGMLRMDYAHYIDPNIDEKCCAAIVPWMHDGNPEYAFVVISDTQRTPIVAILFSGDLVSSRRVIDGASYWITSVASMPASDDTRFSHLSGTELPMLTPSTTLTTWNDVVDYVVAETNFHTAKNNYTGMGLGDYAVWGGEYHSTNIEPFDPADMPFNVTKSGIVSGTDFKKDGVSLNVVSANPTSVGASDLNKIKIADVTYNIPKGIEVEANPSGVATDELDSVRIGNIVYDIPSGSGANNAVTQTANSDDEDYRVLLSHSPDDVTETSGVYKHGYLTYNPDLQVLSVPTVESNLLESSNVSISDDVYLKDGGYWVDQNFTSIGDIAQAVHDTPIVTANPSGTATGSLTSLGINNVIYEISGGGGGTTVIANPSGEATADLTKIQIGNTIYDIEGGGGSSENKIPYLKSSGAQYIDTGIVAKGSISICTEFFIDLDQYDPSESWATVYCGQDGNESNSIAYAYNQSTGTNSLQYGNNHNEPEYQIVPEVIHKAGVVKGKTFIDNNIRSYGVTSFSSNYNIALFAANAGGSIVGNSKYCLVSCKIWDGNTLVRDFIPTTDNNVPCLLDRVNNTYYYNQGSGADFTYGERTISLVSKSGGGGGGTSYTDVTGTLTTGQTTLTLTNSAITTNSTLDFYTDTFGVNPTDVTVTTGSVTLTFEEQANDIDVKVRVS